MLLPYVTALLSYGCQDDACLAQVAGWLEAALAGVQRAPSHPASVGEGQLAYLAPPEPPPPEPSPPRRGRRSSTSIFVNLLGVPSNGGRLAGLLTPPPPVPPGGATPRARRATPIIDANGVLRRFEWT